MPEILFATGLVPSNALDQFTAVGDRFLLRLPASSVNDSPAPVEVLVNWARRGQ